MAFIGALAPLNATSIEDLLQVATAVVAGTGSAPVGQGKTLSFALTVERSFMGPLSVNETVQVQSDPGGRPIRFEEGSSAIRGIWFLKQSAGGDWLCIPAAHSGNAPLVFRLFPYPVSQDAIPRGLAYDDRSTSLRDKLVLEVAAANPANPGLLLNAASGLHSPAALTALRFAAGGNERDNALFALSALIESGDIAAMQLAEKQAPLEKSGASGRLVSAISLFRNPDPGSVASLGHLALNTSNMPELRLAATQALAAIHSAAAVPFLGAVIRDPSPAMQLTAARGLSFFANGVGIPTADTMRTLNHLNQRQPGSYASADTERISAMPLVMRSNSFSTGPGGGANTRSFSPTEVCLLRRSAVRFTPICGASLRGARPGPAIMRYARAAS